MKYSFIITAWKEPVTTAQIIERILNPEFGNNLEDMEIVLSCPDEETKIAAESVVDKYSFSNYVYVKDPGKGKPIGLNCALEVVKGEILIFTDGDVLIESNSLRPLVSQFEDQNIGGVTARPISADSKSSLFGYFGNLLADVAHKRRTSVFQNGGYYFMSGYLYAMRNFKDIRFPEDVLSDDAWVTLKILEKGYKIGYAPDSRVSVPYPKNFKDWIKQKRRSLGGYSHLKSLQDELIKKGIVNSSLNRKFTTELSYFFFPFTYASNPKEFLYSLLLYPARLWLWIQIWWNVSFKKKSFEQIWQRVESTK